jgi:uncharacterized protein YidB (DUF937 family)
MGIFDEVVGAVEKHPEISQEQHESLVRHAIDMFGNQGVISKISSHAGPSGLDGALQSLGGGGAGVENLVGQNRINELASRVGISPAIASAALSQLLPSIVQRLRNNAA